MAGTHLVRLSVDGKVAFSYHSQSEPLVWSTRGRSSARDESSYKEYIRVLEAKTTPSGPDSFGPVSSGQIALACSNLICGRLGHVNGPEDLAGTTQCDCGLGVFLVVINCWKNDLFQDGGSVYLLPFLKGITRYGA